MPIYASLCLIVAVIAAKAQAIPVPAKGSSLDSACEDDWDELLERLANNGIVNIPVSSCQEAAGLGACENYWIVQTLCTCSCSPSPPPPPSPPTSPPPPSPPSWANANVSLGLSFGADPLQALDLYETSAASETTVPCIMYVHGGGWRGGDKNDVPTWALALRQHGYHVASTNYRLTWSSTHPAQIEDVESAVRYLKDHASTYNLDPSKIVVIGASAGGHLVALLGTRNGPGSEARVAGVVDFFGPTVLYGGNTSSEQITMLLGCNTFDDPTSECYEAAVNASPAAHAAADNPPFLILHGTDDPTVGLVSSTYFQAQLESVGADSTLVIVPGVEHAKDRIVCGQTNGTTNLDHLYGWINATLSLGAPGGIVAGGGTVWGDDLGGACSPGFMSGLV